ncbi:hypothetical protein J5X84_31380 [Streptosporangiaceae bacterium NEAU-GS5]|nr:hypothetical protein [Streptosporangiaceae bacterium NEAU-GS5]
MKHRGDLAFAAFFLLVLAAIVGVLVRVNMGPAKPKEPDIQVMPFPAEMVPFPWAGQLWPQALVKVPVWSAEDSRYHPLASLDRTHILVQEIDGSTGAFSLLRLDTTTNTTTRLGEMPKTKDLTGHQILAARVDARSIVWYLTAATAGGATHQGEFWLMPRLGTEAAGKATLLATIDDVPADIAPRFAITDETIVWSSANGLRRIPLSGGDDEEFPGTMGLHLQDWPWASRDAGVVNVLTGEAHLFPKLTQVTLGCGPRWCVGKDHGSRVVVQSTDGKRYARLPAWVTAPLGLVSQRYLLLRTTPPANNPAGSRAPSSIAYDLDTGQVGTLMTKWGNAPVLGDGGVNLGLGDGLAYWASPDRATHPPKSDAKRQLVDSAAAFAMAHQGADAFFGVPEKFWLLNFAALGS